MSKSNLMFQKKAHHSQSLLNKSVNDVKVRISPAEHDWWKRETPPQNILGIEVIEFNLVCEFEEWIPQLVTEFWQMILWMIFCWRSSAQTILGQTQEYWLLVSKNEKSCTNRIQVYSFVNHQWKNEKNVKKQKTLQEIRLFCKSRIKNNTKQQKRQRKMKKHAAFFSLFVLFCCFSYLFFPSVLLSLFCLNVLQVSIGTSPRNCRAPICAYVYSTHKYVRVCISCAETQAWFISRSWTSWCNSQKLQLQMQLPAASCCWASWQDDFAGRCRFQD